MFFCDRDSFCRAAILGPSVCPDPRHPEFLLEAQVEGVVYCELVVVAAVADGPFSPGSSVPRLSTQGQKTRREDGSVPGEVLWPSSLNASWLSEPRRNLFLDVRGYRSATEPVKVKTSFFLRYLRPPQEDPGQRVKVIEGTIEHWLQVRFDNDVWH